MSGTKTTRTVTVVPFRRPGRMTAAHIQLPGNPRFVRFRSWMDGTCSYDYADGSRLVIPGREEDRLNKLARRRRKPFAAEIEECEEPGDWGDTLGFFEDDNPEAP
jgi:hypothetical protein